MENKKSKIRYEVILETDRDGYIIGYFDTLENAKDAIKADRKSYCANDVKNLKNSNAKYCIIDYKENYGRVFQNKEELNDFFDEIFVLNMNTNFVYPF